MSRNELKKPLKNGGNLIHAAIFYTYKKCFVCGCEDLLEFHHIKPKKFYPDLYNDPNNIVGVCRQCHDRIHFECINPIELRHRFINTGSIHDLNPLNDNTILEISNEYERAGVVEEYNKRSRKWVLGLSNKV
jgi:hypothetical protein